MGRQLIIATQFLQFSVKYLLYMYYIFTANLVLYSGLVTQPRNISVSGTLITQNHVHYIGITFIYLTSPFFYHIFLDTSLISFHVNIRFAPNIEHTSVLCDIHGPTPRNTRTRSSTYSAGNPRGSAPISGPDLCAHL